MCGIVGIVSKSKNKEKELKKMMDRIRHRGPDGDGNYIDGDFALGHLRLSIIDLKTGSQPMISQNKNFVIVFNGEIYNYLELKSELESLGHKFKTKSDTEVLLTMFEEYGEKMLPKLRGMFAFVIYDKFRKEIFGARDHFGIKPLYYYHKDDVFLFASEIKAFMDHPKFKKELNEKVLPLYLSFNYSPTEETFFKDVKKLEPGRFFKYSDGVLQINRYFKITFAETERPYKKTVNEIDKVIKDSVNKHLISDVEVGSFLSSGIDSSYIVSLAKPKKTYTIGYEISKYDETNYAKELADILKLENKTHIITKEEYFKEVPNILYHLDEPLSDPAAVSLYFVSKLASKDVKVVLSGEGADELFGGYNYYREVVDMAFYNKIPYFIRRPIGLLASLFGERRGINFLVRRGQKLEDNYIGVTKVFSEKERKKILLNTDNIIKNKEITKHIYEEQAGQNDVIKMQAIDINFWLIKDILQKADKMTMASSIEGRVPFTDIEVFNVARTLNFDAKVTKENTKVALREAAKRYIPTEAYNKKKLGFPVPLREWLKEKEIYDKIRVDFNGEVAKKFFKIEQINKILDDNYLGKKDNYKKVWTIYCFIIWYKQYF